MGWTEIGDDDFLGDDAAVDAVWRVVEAHTPDLAEQAWLVVHLIAARQDPTARLAGVAPGPYGFLPA